MMLAKEYDLPCVSIIVIGHNEAKHLKGCFEAINQMDYPKDRLEIIYVDSNSSDNSVEIANAYSDIVISNKVHNPTAGLAFNAGIKAARHEMVHITGGDIKLDSTYLKIAIQTLMNDDSLSVVTGYFVEKNETGWNRLLGYRREDDLDKTDHFVTAPNGGTFKKSALVDVNGYDERIKKGQETELGLRLRQRKHKILYKKIRQGVHNFDTNTFLAVVKRFFKDGVSSGHGAVISVFESSNDFFMRQRKNTLHHLVFYTLLLLTVVFSVSNKNVLVGGVVLTIYIGRYFGSVWFFKKGSVKYKLYRTLLYFMGLAFYAGTSYCIAKTIVFLIQGKQIYSKMKGLADVGHLR